MKVLGCLLLSLFIVCASSEMDSCIKFCSFNHRPVCATNGICIFEFKNKCILSNNNCDYKENNQTEFKSIPKALCYKPDNPCHPEDILFE